MFSKVVLFITAAFAATAVLAQDSKCNSGPVQCCGSLQSPDSEAASKQLSLLGIAVQNVVGQVGLECNPITGIGAGTGANCASSPVCCEHNFQNQLVGINCSPVTVGA